MKAPVHTAATRRASAWPRHGRKRSGPGQRWPPWRPVPPGSTRVSIRSPEAWQRHGAELSGRSRCGPGPPCNDATRTRYPARLPSDSGSVPGAGEHLVRPGDVDQLHAVEGDEDHRQLADGSTLAVAHRWRQRHVPHIFGHGLGRSRAASRRRLSGNHRYGLSPPGAPCPWRRPGAVRSVWLEAGPGVCRIGAAEASGIAAELDAFATEGPAARRSRRRRLPPRAPPRRCLRRLRPTGVARLAGRRPGAQRKSRLRAAATTRSRCSRVASRLTAPSRRSTRPWTSSALASTPILR